MGQRCYGYGCLGYSLETKDCLMDYWNIQFSKDRILEMKLDYGSMGRIIWIGYGILEIIWDKLSKLDNG